MSVLKIKNEEGQWTGIPTIKGEKGDSGVYVGAEAPPADEETNVWIDTTSEPRVQILSREAFNALTQKNPSVAYIVYEPKAEV